MEKKVLISQPAGIGDSMFARGIAKHFQKEGYKIYWPTKLWYVDQLSRAYPDTVYECDTKYKDHILIKEDKEFDGFRIIPIRWSDSILGKEARWWMRTKYDLYNLDFTKWKDSAMWERDEDKEQELFDKVVGNEYERYNLIQTIFRSDYRGSIQVNIDNGLRNIQLDILDGYSLFDWAMVIERAENIHFVNTSSLYLLELLELKAKELHLYCRKPDEVDFRYVDYLLEKEYVFHF